jgi:hypothetical protein
MTSFLLLIISLAVGFAGVATFTTAKTAINEIEALVILLGAVVLFTGALVSSCIEHGRKAIVREVDYLSQLVKTANKWPGVRDD